MISVIKKLSLDNGIENERGLFALAEVTYMKKIIYELMSKP